MPQPWEQDRIVGQPQVQPQPFPGAQLPMGGNVANVQTQAEADQRAALAHKQDTRAEQALQNENTRLRMAAEEHDRKTKSEQPSGGVPVNATEGQAAGHARLLLNNVESLRGVLTKDPEAMKPTWRELLVKGLSPDNSEVQAALTAYTQNGQRQIADNAYNGILDSAIWLSTGAAAPESQITRIRNTLVPTPFDKPEDLADKWKRVQSYISDAKLRAGAGNIPLQQALEEASSQMAPLYGSGIVAPSGKQTLALSGTEQAISLPKGYQDAHAAYLAAHPPGTLKVGDYIDFRHETDKKFERDSGPMPEAEAWVKAYNAGHGSTQIPEENRQLGSVEKLAAGAAADKGALGDLYTGIMNAANAGSAGLPMRLAGQEGRAASHMANEAHPISAIAGDIAGGIAPTLGLESIVGGGLSKLGSGEVGTRVGREILANSAYGAARGANEAEPGNRGIQAFYGGAVGAVAPLVGRAAVRGAKGFLSAENGNTIERLLSEQKFVIPGERMPLPVEAVTPAAYQSMSEAQLREAAANAERDLGTHQAARAQHEAGVEAQKQDFAKNWMQAKTQAEQLALVEKNKQLQAAFLADPQNAMLPSGTRQRWAEEAFPTTPEGVAEALRTGPKPEVSAGVPAPEVSQYQAPEGLDSPEVLAARKARIEQHLATPNTPSEGVMPAVNLTTMQRAGLGRLEESATALPFVRGARQAVDESYTKRKVAEALSTAGVPLPKAEGSMELFDKGYQALGEKYDKLAPMTQGNITKNFDNSIAALRAKTLGAAPSAERRDAWNEIETAVQGFRKTGKFDAQGFRELSDRLRQISEAYGDATDSVVKTDVARAAGQVKDRLVDLLGENNPAAAAAYKPLNKAYAQFSQLQKATKYKSSRMEGSTVAPEPLYDAMYKADSSPDKMDFTRGKFPGQKDVKAELDIIGGKVPAKDSLGQTAIAGGVLGYGGFIPKATAVLAGAGYVPGTKQFMQALLRGYPEKAATALSDIAKGDGSSKLRKVLGAGLSPEALQQLITQSLREYSSKFNGGK